MPVSKLKNLAILILLLSNLALLAVLAPGRMARRQEADALHRSLCSLYETHEIALEPSVIADTVRLYELELQEDEAAGLAAAEALLGETPAMEQDEAQYQRTYTSSHGRCTFHRDGGFTAGLTDQKEHSDQRRSCRRLLQAMDFSVHTLTGPERLRAGVFTLQATQSVLGVPVFSDGLTLTLENNRLTALEGTFFLPPSTLLRTSSTPCLSAADALVAFLSARYELGWVGAAVTAMEQGYLPAEAAPSAPVRLTPGWRLQTDTGAFWVNGMTGAVSAIG